MDRPDMRAADRAAVRLLPDQDEIRLSERALAVARVLLTIAALFVASILLQEQPGIGVGLMRLYVAFALIWLVIVLRARRVSTMLPLVIQVVDLAFVAALAFFPIGGTVPFFSFLLFPLFTAASRWGFREVMVTAFVIEAVILVEAVVAPGVFETTALPRLVAIAAAGAAIGYLAEQQRRRHFEDRALAVILSRARVGGTLTDTVNLVLASVRSAFRAREVLVVFKEQFENRVMVWQTDAATSDELSARPMQLPAARHKDYWFDEPGAGWHAWLSGRRRAGRFSTVAVDQLGRRLQAGKITLPVGFLDAHRCRRVIGASLQLSDEWLCRLFVLDPGMGVHREQTARFALKLAQTVGPALYNNYLIRSLRTRAQALERGRIAREMHDGVTQSLLGLEMEIAVLRRRAKAEAPPLVDDLARIHGIVRDEVVTVRELMEGIRVNDLVSGDLIQHLSGVVDRFSRYTGVSARFLSDGKPVSLSQDTRRQVARIVHEALVNVRKHSGADRVVVRVGLNAAAWKVSIEDDGRGFPFAGRLTIDELEAQRKGPRSIAERTRIIGGALIVDSRPGFGARVEVSVPITTPKE
jgi:signal transduction histidine kinase